MQDPLISIITPAYNHEQFIEECILSVISQSYAHWEMIIVDDGSTDQTYRIAQSYAEKDSRIRVLTQANKGPARLEETYNTALQLAQGEWIAVLEGDDYWLPDKLSIQTAACQDPVILSYGLYHDQFGEVYRAGIRPPFTGTITVQEFIPLLLLHQSYLIAVTMLIRKQSLLSIGGFHQDGSPGAVDMATLMRLIRLPGCVHYEAQYLGVWRHHLKQSTNLLRIDLAKFNAGLVFEYLDSLSPDEYRNLGTTREEILHARRAVQASAYFTTIRQKLLQQSRDNLFPLIKEMWTLGGLKRKFQAVYILCAYLLHSDIELPLQLADRLSSKPFIRYR
jgi:glycosyltransferase involved in cell wall biosynthesis